MKENYLINIEGTMEQDGDTDTVSLMTRGSFVQRGGNYFISYKETAATGFEGCTTTVKIENSNKVSMLRFGKAPSQLIIECGKRHVCHYDGGYGVLNLGIVADVIENKLSQSGGELTFSYTLDTNETQISRNKVIINVRETN